MSTGQERRCQVKDLFLDHSLMSPRMPRGNHELGEDIIASEANANSTAAEIRLLRCLAEFLE